MALVTSGNQLHMQGTSDTNPSTTTQSTLLNDTWTTGLDGLFQIQQLDEIGDGQFIAVTNYQGDAYGFWSGAFSSSYIHSVFGFGAGLGSDRYNGLSTFGSGVSTFSDGGGTTRTISAIWWALPDASPTNKRLFVFALNGTGISNSDTTFNKIEIITNGGTTVTINRSDLSYDSSENGDTFWYMSASSGTNYNNIGSLGTPSSGTTYTIKVYGPSVTTTSNTGIAEEFGGADSSDVKMSDYYKGAASGYVNTGTGTANIPTSGSPISFSDFYGASYVSNVLSAVEIQPAAKYELIAGPRGGNYEHILHGLGHQHLETHQTSYTSMSSTTNNDSAQGSVVGSPNLATFGVSSSFGTLRSMLHGTFGPAGATSFIILIVGQTGSNSNAGFTTLTITRSGMTTLTLTRANADDYNYYTADGGTRLWRWAGSPYGNASTVNDYDTGSSSSSTSDSLIFPGGSGSGSANTTTTSRSTWTIS